MATAESCTTTDTIETDNEGCPAFRTYEKMADSLKGWRGREVDSIKQWVVLEKIHGANFSITIWRGVGDQIKTRVGKRTSYLDEGQGFFSVEKQYELQEELRSSAMELWHLVMADGDVCDQLYGVTVFGELFGGFYPHPDVPRVPKTTRVQCEVAYCPQLKFIAYDIRLLYNNNRQVYMDYDKAMILLGSSHFLFSEPLLVGSLQDAVDYPLGFHTHLPAQFKLPPIEDNLAEGVVIKPLKNSMVKQGDVEMRAIFKRKIEKFSERKAIPSLDNKDKKKKEVHMEDFEVSNLEMIKYEMYALVTRQRLTNTISKVGIPSSREEWKKLKDLLTEDVLDSLREENDELWGSIVNNSTIMEILVRETEEQCSQLMDVSFEGEKERLEQESLEKLTQELGAIATQQRLLTIIGDDGLPNTSKKIKMLKKLLMKNISEQLKNDHNESWACVADNNDVMRTLLKEIGQACSEVVDTYCTRSNDII